MGTSTLREGPERVKSALEVAALVLAAGQSQRFGGEKLLVPFRGRPLAAHAFATAAAAQERGVIARGAVVVAADGERTKALASEAGLDLVLNDDPAQGVARSLQLGLEYLAATEVSAVLILLADQPLVRLDVLASLVAAWRRSGSPVVRPCYADDPDVPGHPVLLDRGAWWLRHRLTGDRGLASLLSLVGTPPELVTVPGRNPDVDTPADLHSLERPD
jgi:molybdenum cofactor cytidylyltransferase